MVKNGQKSLRMFTHIVVCCQFFRSRA